MSFSFNFFIILLLNTFIFSTVVKDNKNIKLIKSSKDCKIIEECHICSFNELKTIDECQVTGYKKKMSCFNNNEEKIYYDSCSENMGINSVYIFLIICILIFICSYRYHKSQKDSTLKNLMVKLSILKN